MTGYVIVTKEKRQIFGGYCPKGRYYNISGGVAGGGASCGPGAGI